MTTSRITTNSINSESATGQQILPWVHRAMEALWLLTVFLVPLAFLNQDYVISEARIAFVEVPKVALLRTLGGLLFLLWLIEWAIKTRPDQVNRSENLKNDIMTNLHPLKVLRDSRRWLGVHPIRWLIFSAGLFFGSTLLSTILSGSFINSMWGEIPGQDGYSAYTIAAYFILFGVVATHVRNQGQVARLIGVVVVMGSLVGLYGIFQHFSHDFLNITESSGGGSTRVTIFMGNTIFAGAVLSMTVPATLLASALVLNHADWGNITPLAKMKEWHRDSIFTFLWSSTLTIQLLGLMFTFSRGPWAGAILPMLVLLVIIATMFGWRLLIQVGLVIGLAGVLAVAFLHYTNSVSVINVGSWLGIFIALVGLIGTAGTLFVIRRFSRAIVFLALSGVTVTILAAAIVGPSALSARGYGEPTKDGGSAASLVTERISSVRTDVLGGLIGGRGTHWKISWELVKNRPWFEFDTLHFRWLRPFVGYGPDLFRYTYLLESPPDTEGFRPLEPDHAHNFFIHQAVEQGIFGLVSSLALFLSVFGIALQQFIRRRKTASPLYRMLLFGLMAILLGRFLEMMVGVARISDLTVLWVIFALFAALINLDEKDSEPAEVVNDQPAERPNRRGRRRGNRGLEPKTFNLGLFVRVAVVAWVIGGIGVVTWQKSINPVRAAVAEGKALEFFDEGDLENSIKQLDRAIKLAPGVPSYYNNRAQVFFTYQIRPELLTEPGCAQQDEVDYQVCLGLQNYNSNLQSVAEQPFYFRSRVATGNSAFNLRLNEAAINAYKQASSMVPNSWSVRNDLAESLIDGGRYQEALTELNRGLEVTGDEIQSTRALYLKGRSLKEQGLTDEALFQFKKGLFIGLTSESAEDSIKLIREINGDNGNTFNVDYFSDLIEQNPKDVIAFYNRGLGHLGHGNFDEAYSDMERVLSGGLITTETRALWGYLSLKIGDFGRAGGVLVDSLKVEPQNALFNVFYGELQLEQGNFASALNYLENANVINEDLGLAYLLRAKIFLEVGLEDSAREVLEPSQATELFSAYDYAERGKIQGLFGNYDWALEDLNIAIGINPNRAGSFWERAKIHIILKDNASALADLNAALRIEPINYEYLLGRGVLHAMIGDIGQSSADFAEVVSGSNFEIPLPANRNATYFASDESLGSAELEARMTLKFRSETENLRNICRAPG